MRTFARLTVCEAIAATPAKSPRVHGIAPGSWINANFDVWIGHREDITAWEFVGRGPRSLCPPLAAARGRRTAPPRSDQLLRRIRGAADGRRQRLVLVVWARAFFLKRCGIRRLLPQTPERGLQIPEPRAPDEFAEPIKRKPERGTISSRPRTFSMCAWTGGNPAYFEWLGAGLYSPEGRDGSMHGRVRLLKQLRYGFDAEHFVSTRRCF